jgi:membrane protein YdbS with pleckstrin-like domain
MYLRDTVHLFLSLLSSICQLKTCPAQFRFRKCVLDIVNTFLRVYDGALELCNIHSSILTHILFQTTALLRT